MIPSSGGHHEVNVKNANSFKINLNWVILYSHPLIEE